MSDSAPTSNSNERVAEGGRRDREQEEEEDDVSMTSSLTDTNTTTSTNNNTNTTKRAHSHSSSSSSARKSHRTMNTIISAATPPDLVGEKLKAVLKNHAPPKDQRWVRVEPPVPNKNRSIAWDYGVAYDMMDGEAIKMRRWWCCATQDCRDRGVPISCTAASLSNLTTHLSVVHGVKSARSTQMHQSKLAHEQRLGQATAEKYQMMRENGEKGGVRYEKLKYVKNIVVGTFQPHNYLEHEHVRHHYKSLNPNFPVEELHHKNVRHFICELYAATKEALKQELAGVTSRPTPTLSISIDIWEDKFCAKKFLGLRVRWIDDNWMPQSRLVSLRGFAPCSELQDEFRLSRLLYMWVEACLAEIGLAKHHFVGASTDSGSDVKRCTTADDCMGLPREWCGNHLINRALVESLGFSEQVGEGSNESARGVIMEVRKVITHISKSAPMKAVFQEEQMVEFGKSLKLKNMAYHRWSSARETLERVLHNWKPILRTYHMRSKRTELKALKPQLVEMYTLFRAMDGIMKELQSNSTTSGPQFVLRMNELLKKTLNLEKPLLVVDPSIAAAKKNGGASSQTATTEAESVVLPVATHKEVHPRDLTELGKMCRAKLRAALISRFVENRYQSTGDMTDVAYIYDAACVAHPRLARDMKWVDQMSDTAVHAAIVKDKIKSVILRLLEDIFDVEGPHAGGRGCSSSTAHAQQRQTTMMDVVKPSSDIAALSDDDEDTGDTGEVEVTAEEWAKERLKNYLEWCATKDERAVAEARGLPWEGLPEWWRKTGTRLFPSLATVFQALLAVPGGAAALERDFSVASNLLTVRRAMLDQAYVEMTMFLRLSMDKIPALSQIPVLTSDAAAAAIPPRLRNKKDFEAFRELEEVEEEEEINSAAESESEKEEEDDASSDDDEEEDE